MAAILKVKDGNGNVIPIQAIKGEKGDKGDKGDRGLPGSGGVPDGGTTGQVLTKNSDADGDAGWTDISGYLSEKLDKNQGTANSGKFLGIGADGIVVPTEVGGGSEWVQVAKLKTEEDLHYITVSADSNGNELSFDEAYVIFVASKSSTDSSGNFGIGLRNWTTSFNGKTALYNYQIYNDAYIYAWYVKNISDVLGAKVEGILMNRFGNNLDSVSFYSDSVTPITYRAKDTAAEHSTIIRGSNVTKNTNGKLTTITLGADMSSSIGFKAGCYLEVFVR